MTGIECRCHPTQRSSSMLLGFLTVEICHRMIMKSCIFVMLGGNHGLSASTRERRKELEYAPWASTRRFFLLLLCIHGEIAVFWYECPFGSLSVCYVMSCSSLSLLQLKPGDAWGSCLWVVSVQIASNEEVTLMYFSLLLHWWITFCSKCVKRLFQKETSFFLDV